MLLRFFAACGVFVLSAGLVSATPAWQQVNLTIVDQHLLPSYQQLAKASAGLMHQSQQFCANVNAKQLQAFQAEYHKTMDAWSNIQHIRFGVVDILMRYHRIQLWPDKHNTGAKQIRKLLATQDRQVLKPDYFKRASVAIQGLGTLERILFNSKGDTLATFKQAPKGAYRCELAVAISRNVHEMSQGMVSDWTQGDYPYRDIIKSAERGNDFYESSLNVSARFLNNLSTAIQSIVEQKLARPLDKNLQRAKPRRAESWRSQRSLKNIINNLQATQTLYEVGFSSLVKDRALDDRINMAFKQAIKSAQRIKQPLSKAVKDPKLRVQLIELQTQCQTLHQLLASTLPEAIGLPIGFNNLDGD